MKKYEITEKKIEMEGRVLHRIRALKKFSDINEGDYGGFIENKGI